MSYHSTVAKDGAASYHMIVSTQNKKIDVELERGEFDKKAGYCNKSSKAVAPLSEASNHNFFLMCSLVF